MSDVIHLGKYRDCLDAVCPIRSTGTVTNIIGLVVESPWDMNQQTLRGLR